MSKLKELLNDKAAVVEIVNRLLEMSKPVGKHNALAYMGYDGTICYQQTDEDEYPNPNFSSCDYILLVHAKETRTPCIVYYNRREEEFSDIFNRGATSKEIIFDQGTIDLKSKPETAIKMAIAAIAAYIDDNDK